MSEKTSVLRRSYLWRMIMAIGSFFKYSLIGRFLGAFKKAWPVSRTSVLTERMLGADAVATENSVYNKIYTAVARAISRVGAKVRPAAENSLLNKLWNAKWLRGGLLWRALFGHTMRRFVIVVFALYLPVDWALRELPYISALASVWDEAFLAFGFAYAVFLRLCAPESEKARTTPLDTLILAFCGLGLGLMFVTMESFSIALAGYRAVVQYMLWFFILTRIIREDGDVDSFVLALSLTGLFCALHGIVQYILGVEIPENWVSQAEQGVRTRVFSIIGSPNIMGSFMIMVAPLAASYAYKVEKLWQRAVAWCAVGAIALACLLTFSRGAWMGFAVMIAAFAWLRDKRLFALIALAASFAVMIPDVVGRITFLFTDEFAHATKYGGREGRARDGLKLLATANELLGYGLGRFGGAVAMQNQTNPDIVYFYMDNYYLKTLVEMGYLGLGGYVVLLVGTVYTGLRAVYRSKGTRFAAVSAALLAGMVGVIAHCFTENIFEVPYMNAYFWGMAAVLVWLGFLRKPKPEEIAK